MIAPKCAFLRRPGPHTDFSRHSVGYDEVFSSGPPKDGIPAIDGPSFVPVSGADHLASHEPVISIHIGTEAPAYPLRIMIWHEISATLWAAHPAR